MPELLLDRLARHTASGAQRPAYTFLREAGESETLTYQELSDRVWGLATQLREWANVGERAVILLPNSLDFAIGFLACLGSGVVAVPAYPPRRNRKAERLKSIIEDCKPTIVLTTEEIHERDDLRELVGRASVITIDRTWSKLRPEVETAIPPDSTAFLQYTSGSTGQPKGVMVSHAALATNQIQIEKAFNAERLIRPTRVSWLPMFHDMGLVGGMLQPIFSGGHGVLMSPENFLRDPFRWLKAVTDFRAVHTGGPNFAFEHAARTITEEQRRQLDLSSLEVVYCGAEPIRPETIDRFVTAFAPCGLDPKAMFPCYGMAETTLFVSGGPVGEGAKRFWVSGTALEAGRIEPADPITEGGRCLIGCGEVGEGNVVLAVDPATGRPVPEGRVGELWVSSPSLGAGYWQRPDESKATFCNRLPGYSQNFLRTGDLGFVRRGWIFVTGRLKDVIIVRGRNVYPQDIETAVTTALKLPSGGNACAAFSVDVAGEERVGLVIEADREMVRQFRSESPSSGISEPEKIVTTVRRAVSQTAAVPLHAIIFVKPGSFPRTSSGKVQRQECRRLWLNSLLEPIHSWTATTTTDAIYTTPPPNAGEDGRRSSIIIRHERHITGSGVTGMPTRRSGSISGTLERRTGLITNPERSLSHEDTITTRLLNLVQITLQLPPGALLDSHASLTDWGLESLTAFNLYNRIEQEFKVRLPISAMPDPWTIEGLRRVIEKQLTVPTAPALALDEAIGWSSASDLADDPALLSQLHAIVATTFDQPEAVLERVIGVNQGVYLGYDELGRIHSFLFHRTGTLLLGGRTQSFFILGLNCSREDVRSSGATLPLYSRCLRDAAGNHPMSSPPLLVCGTTMNPSVLAAAERALGDFSPALGAEASPISLARTIALREKLGYDATVEGDPHVIHGAFRPFAYTPTEGKRLNMLIERSGHPLLRGLRPDRCDGVLFHGWLQLRPSGTIPHPTIRERVYSGSGVVSRSGTTRTSSISRN